MDVNSENNKRSINEMSKKQEEAHNTGHLSEEFCSHNASNVQVNLRKQNSKKSIKKRENHKRHLERKQSVRAEKRKAKRERERQLRKREEGQGSEKRLSKRDDLQQKRQKLKDALNDGQRVCIDLSMSNVMSSKEVGKLAMQIGRVYGANKKAEKPMHLMLANCQSDSDIHKACVQKNDGFNNYLIEKSGKPLLEIFPSEEIVYLSPDSDKVLEVLDDSKVYVIGGLVDENPIKCHTLNNAIQCNLATARLPIEEYMQRLPNGSYNKILAVNQVFEILLNIYNGGDWSEALYAGVPRRKGFIPKCSPDG